MNPIARLLTDLITKYLSNFLSRPKPSDEKRVYLPTALAIVGAIPCALFLALTLGAIFTNEPLWVCILGFLLTLLGASLIIAVINCRITYDEESFVAKSFWGFKRRYTYDQVTGIKENTHEKYIYLGNKRIMVDEFAIGGTEFLHFVRKKYHDINNRMLPQITKTKHDIFKGNVKNSGTYLFVYVLIGVIAVGLLLFTMYHAFAPSTPDNTIEQSVRFVSCQAEDCEIVLTSADDQLYKIRFIDEQFDVAPIRNLCDGESLVTTYSKKYTPDGKPAFYSLSAIMYNDAYLLTFEQTNKFHANEYAPLILLPAVFILGWIAFVTLSVIVGRNPHKFSKKFATRFFNKGDLRY